MLPFLDSKDEPIHWSRRPRSPVPSRGGRLPAFPGRLGVRSVFGPAQDILRVAVRESRLRDPHALEIRVQHDREAGLYFSAGREGPLRRIPLGAVGGGSGMGRERAFLDYAFACAVERVAEEHEIVGI